MVSVTISFLSSLQNITKEKGLNLALTGEEISIISVLTHLQEKFGREFEERIYSGGKLNNYIIIMVNGKDVRSLDDLETKINDGDEIIVPNPGYPTYRSVTKFLGAKPVPVKLREENDFRFLVSDLEDLITPKTRMIILNSPENPTGGQLTWEDLEAIHIFH